MRFLWPIWLIGLSTACCLAGCGGGEQPNEMSAELSIPTVYKQNCMSCHGNQLQGRVGPNLQTVGSRLTEEKLIQLINDGKGGMPAYGKRLSEDDIASIAAWLAEQK
ncbi:c-type cytochrome [Paenibacillus sp. GCM10012303]|uniref:c-type cytochrome n=1 Tax=Paenibacillus sp. GCM10012303 TaxID=3317340 RepID=UPI00362429AB